MQVLKNLSIVDYLSKTASGDPIPGGGLTDDVIVARRMVVKPRKGRCCDQQYCRTCDQYLAAHLMTQFIHVDEKAYHECAFGVSG